VSHSLHEMCEIDLDMPSVPVKRLTGYSLARWLIVETRSPAGFQRDSQKDLAAPHSTSSIDLL